MKIAVGSTNPVKMSACKFAFEEIFAQEIEIIGFSPEILVAKTPYSIGEMISGARQRAVQAQEQNLECEYAIGIEGGLYQQENLTFLTAFAVVVDKKDNEGIGGAPVIQLPTSWSFQSSFSFEFGDYVDKISNRTNIKQQEGAMGYLTKNKVTRTTSLKLAVICAYYALENNI